MEKIGNPGSRKIRNIRKDETEATVLLLGASGFSSHLSLTFQQKLFQPLFSQVVCKDWVGLFDLKMRLTCADPYSSISCSYG